MLIINKNDQITIIMRALMKANIPRKVHPKIDALSS
jgi:hypothetical protein